MGRTIYLAGPISHITYDQGNNWREYAADILKKHNISVASPLRHKEYLRKYKDPLPTVVPDSCGPLSTNKGITTRDRFDVMTSDAVLMNLLGAEKVSIGSMIEVGRSDTFRKPLVLVMNKENIHRHGMLLEISGYVVPTLDEGLEICVALFS